MSLMRRREMMQANSGTVYPFYSDYPTITEYGQYVFTAQTDATTLTNTFIKMDNTAYAYAGGGAMNKSFAVEYSEQKLIVYNSAQIDGRIWITKEQESSNFSLKRCAGTESSPPLVVFKVDRIQ